MTFLRSYLRAMPENLFWLAVVLAGLAAAGVVVGAVRHLNF